MIERKLASFPVKFPHMPVCEAPSPAQSIRIPAQVLMIARRGSGKTFSAYLLLKQLISWKLCHRIFVLSPTWKAPTNKSLFDDLQVDPKDCFEDPSVASLRNVLETIEEEGEVYKKFLMLKTAHTRLWKALRDDKKMLDAIDPELLLLADAHPELWDREPPTHKYGGRHPCMFIFFDDVQGMPLMRSALFVSLVIKHRHQSFIGVSTISAFQSYSSLINGCPKPLRNNATVLVVFKTHDDKVIDQICSEVSEVPPATFRAMYDHATSVKHRPFIIEVAPKTDAMMYRAGWDTILTPGKLCEKSPTPKEETHDDRKECSDDEGSG